MGYKRKSEDHEPLASVQCAHDLCQYSSIANVKLESGWANLCRKHYEYHAQRKANEFCITSNLETVEAKRAYCRERAAKFGFGGKKLKKRGDDEAVAA